MFFEKSNMKLDFGFHIYVKPKPKLKLKQFFIELKLNVYHRSKEPANNGLGFIM